jgi:hypothetical protein
MRRLCLFFAVMAALTIVVLGQRGGAPPPNTPQDSSNDVRLPSGRMQRDEIIEAEHKKNQEDAATLARLAQEVKDDLDNSGRYIVSVKTIKKLDDIEKLDKGIRARLKRF